MNSVYWGIAIVVLIVNLVDYSAAVTNNIYCYYNHSAALEPGNGKLLASQLDPKLCTHIAYAHVNPEPNGRFISTFNDNAAIDALVALKKTNPKVLILFSLGLSTQEPANLENIVNSATLRPILIQEICTFIDTHKLDGVDVDTNHYGRAHIPQVNETAHFVYFLRDLRAKLGNKKLITAALSNVDPFLKSKTDIPNLNRYLNFISLLTFNFQLGYNKTALYAPLYGNATITDNDDACVESWVHAGISRKKLLLGLPFWGNSYKLKNKAIHGIGAPATGPGLKGPYHNKPGYLSYLEVCLELKKGGWSTIYDPTGRQPYSYKGDQWISYDNVQSLTEKTDYAILQRLGGVMIYTVDNDDHNNNCGGGQCPLLEKVNSIISLTI